jgi:bifunctional non-homologous end joining protein LigD
LPLVERKALLKKLIAAIQFSEGFEVDGPEMFKHACGIGLEGVVSKVLDSRLIRAEATIGSRRPARSARRCQSRAPYAKKITHQGNWVEPSLLAVFEYRAESAEGRFAIPSSRASGRTSDGKGRIRSLVGIG